MKRQNHVKAASKCSVCLHLAFTCHSALCYCLRCFLPPVLLLVAQMEQCNSSGRAHFGFSQQQLTCLYIFGPQCPFSLSSVYREREHRHDLDDVDVTSGHAFRNPSMVLSPLWCLEMAWGHSSWSSVNLSFLRSLSAAKCVSLGSGKKRKQVSVWKVTPLKILQCPCGHFFKTIFYTSYNYLIIFWRSIL